MSMIGQLDWRVDLDKTKNVGDNYYGPSLAIMAAKLSYENEAFTKKVITNNWQVIYYLYLLVDIHGLYTKLLEYYFIFSKDK